VVSVLSDDVDELNYLKLAVCIKSEHYPSVAENIHELETLCVLLNLQLISLFLPPGNASSGIKQMEQIFANSVA